MVRASHFGPARRDAFVALSVLALVAAGVLAFLQFGGDEPVEPGLALGPESVFDVRAPDGRSDKRALVTGNSIEASLDEVDAAAEPTRVEAQPVAVDSASHLHVKLFVRNGRPTALQGSSDRPLPNVHVELVLAAPGDEYDAPTLARVQGDEDGLVELDLDWSLVEAARAKSAAVRLVARVHEIGWQWNTAERDLPLRPGAVELWLVAYPGGTLIVHTRDASGRDVSAEVVATVLSSNEPHRRIEILSVTTQLGRAALHLKSDQTYEFNATAEHVGSAVALDTFVRFADPPQELEFVLMGPGILRGHVTDMRGGPAAGVELEVELNVHVTATAAEELSAPHGIRGIRAIDGPAKIHDGLGGGITLARTVTDHAGAFEITGLRRDLYRIRAVMRGPPFASVELAPAPVLADGSALALVHDRPYLVVRVVDRAGRAWTHPSWAMMPPPELSNYPNTPSTSWPESPRVRVTASPRSGDRDHEPLRASAVVDGAWIFEVEGRREYEVVLDGGDWSAVTRRVNVPASSGRIDIELLGETRGTGQVLVYILGVDGSNAPEALDIRLVDPETGVVVVAQSPPGEYDRFWPPTLDAPVGTWHLVVEGRENTSSYHNPYGAARSLGRVETMVVVSRGARTEVTMTLPPGARLRLTLRGEPLVDPEPAIPLGDGSSSVGFVEAVRSAFPPGANVTLLESGRAPNSVTFDATGVKDIPIVYDAPAWWAAGPPKLGQTRTSFVLPAGSYTLDVRLPDGRSATRPVVLVEGGITEVTMDF